MTEAGKLTSDERRQVAAAGARQARDAAARRGDAGAWSDHGRRAAEHEARRH